MRKVSLDRLVKVLESGSRPKGGANEEGDIFSLGGEHLTYEAEFNWKKKKYISKEYYQKLNKGKIQTNDILIVKDGATTGKVCFVDEHFPFKEAAINEHIFKLEIDPSVINPKYLFWFLFSTGGQKEILKDFRGATVGGITRNFISLAKIPIPDNKQKQDAIASLLSKANRLIEKRKQTIIILDKLVKSLFQDMFGDPYLNNKNWEQVKISSFTQAIKAGWSAKGENRQKEENEFGVLKVSAVTSGSFRSEEHKAIEKSEIQRQLIHPQKGDILFSRANTKELVAATCVVDRDYDELFLPDKLWKIELDKNQVQAFYFKYVLENSGYRMDLSRKATGTSGSMLNISQVKFKNHLFPKPPIKLQEKFEFIVQKIIDEKLKLKTSLKNSELLFKSLLQKAFQGELVFDEDEYETQDGIMNLSWYQSQIESISKNSALLERASKIQNILDNNNTLKSVANITKTLKQFELPALKQIENLNRLLGQFKSPYLSSISQLEQIEELKAHPALKNLNIEDYYYQSEVSQREEEKIKELEKERTRENDPVLKYISETQIGKLTFANFNINVPRFIHESFSGEQFTFEDILDHLEDEYGLININAEKVKTELFNLFRTFIKKEYKNTAFTFKLLNDRLKDKLCNPAFELLHEFVAQELQKKTDLLQAYYPGIMQKTYPIQYKNLIDSEAPSKLYLVSTDGNS